MNSEDLEKFLENPEEAARKEEIDNLLYQLDCIINVDARSLFDEDGNILSPSLWTDEIANSVERLSSSGKGGINVTLASKTKAIDTAAKLKGVFKSEDENRNPLEEALKAVKREDLIVIVNTLRHMGAASSEEEAAA